MRAMETSGNARPVLTQKHPAAAVMSNAARLIATLMASLIPSLSDLSRPGSSSDRPGEQDAQGNLPSFEVIDLTSDGEETPPRAQQKAHLHSSRPLLDLLLAG